MPLTFEPSLNPFQPPHRVRLSIPETLYQRMRGLREKLETRFHIRLGDEDLIDYLCEKALERMEDWERRTRSS